MVAICAPKTGIDRRNLLRGLSCAECAHDPADGKLKLGNAFHPRDTGGEFLALVDGVFGISIDASSAESSVEARHYVYFVKTDTTFRVLEVEYGRMQIARRAIALA